MSGRKISRHRAMRRNEKYENQLIWSELRKKEYLDFSDAIVLMGLGRKLFNAVLFCWAQKVADEFWLEHWTSRKGDGVTKEFGGYGVRVIEQKWTVYIDWFFMNGRGKYLKPEIQNIRLSKGAVRAKKIQFSKAKEWEINAIMKAEDEFEVIRRCAQHLKSINGPVRGFTQLIDGRLNDD
ncbi:conjugative transfer protein MobI(A/C) [Vreelandella indica]|uniref:conjugative transfer protein MobI(A/C) n=1 Tax=Vreelandella indica TaxID=3126500 RepID=UPI00300E4031